MNERATSDVTAGVNPEALALSDLRVRTIFRPDAVRRLSDDLLQATVREAHQRDLGTLVLDLTARHPYADAGYMDMFHPGRWDCESDLVYMTSIHQVGATPSEWDGTAAYARFTAPAAATYIVVVNFSGYQQTMSLNGPWGTSTAYTPTTSDTAAATALWTGTAGQTLYCTFSSKADGGDSGIAFLDSFQVYNPV